MKTLTEPFTVIKVIDTREFIEDDDRFIPIGGSGDAHECDRCDRIHEIHAHVTDAHGNFAVVGVGCMNATTAEARKLAAAATREARNAAKAVAAEAAAAELAALVAALPPFPTDRIDFDPTGGFGAGPVWTVDDAKVYGHPENRADDPERIGCLRGVWLRRRLTDAAGGADALGRLTRLAETSALALVP